jgi:hypothetical protein
MRLPVQALGAINPVAFSVRRRPGGLVVPLPVPLPLCQWQCVFFFFRRLSAAEQKTGLPAQKGKEKWPCSSRHNMPSSRNKLILVEAW